MTVQIKVGWTQKFSIFAKSRSFKKKTLKAIQRSPPHSQHKKEASSKSLLRCKKEAPSHQLRLSTKLKKIFCTVKKESPCRQGLMLPRAYYKITAILKTGFFSTNTIWTINLFRPPWQPPSYYGDHPQELNLFLENKMHILVRYELWSPFEQLAMTAY